MIGSGEAKAREEAAEALTSTMRLFHTPADYLTPIGRDSHAQQTPSSVSSSAAKASESLKEKIRGEGEEKVAAKSTNIEKVTSEQMKEKDNMKFGFATYTAPDEEDHQVDEHNYRRRGGGGGGGGAESKKGSQEAAIGQRTMESGQTDDQETMTTARRYIRGKKTPRGMKRGWEEEGAGEEEEQNSKRQKGSSDDGEEDQGEESDGEDEFAYLGNMQTTRNWQEE